MRKHNINPQTQKFVNSMPDQTFLDFYFALEKRSKDDVRLRKALYTFYESIVDEKEIEYLKKGRDLAATLSLSQRTQCTVVEARKICEKVCQELNIEIKSLKNDIVNELVEKVTDQVISQVGKLDDEKKAE